MGLQVLAAEKPKPQLETEHKQNANPISALPGNRLKLEATNETMSLPIGLSLGY